MRSPLSLVILVVALVLRVAQIAATPHWQPVSDPADYVRHALSIAHGHGMAESFLPHGGANERRRRQAGGDRFDTAACSIGANGMAAQAPWRSARQVLLSRC